jgi:hypothetical protein
VVQRRAVVRVTGQAVGNQFHLSSAPYWNGNERALGSIRHSTGCSSRRSTSTSLKISSFLPGSEKVTMATEFP